MDASLGHLAECLPCAGQGMPQGLGVLYPTNSVKKGRKKEARETGRFHLWEPKDAKQTFLYKQWP